MSADPFGKPTEFGKKDGTDKLTVGGIHQSFSFLHFNIIRHPGLYYNCRFFLPLDSEDKNWTHVPTRKGITQFFKSIRPKSLNMNPDLIK